MAADADAADAVVSPQGGGFTQSAIPKHTLIQSNESRCIWDTKLFENFNIKLFVLSFKFLFMVYIALTTMWFGVNTPNVRFFIDPERSLHLSKL